MYKVLMFGTGKCSILVENVLSNSVEIIAYVDNDKSKWEKKRSGLEIISPNKIKDYKYDYIIIGSQFNEEIYDQLLDLGIDKNKIFQYIKLVDNFWNYLEAYIQTFLIPKSYKYEVLATGISYAAAGFKEEKCCKKAFKFAFASQDLFYDYHTIKYILEKCRNESSNIRYALIGLCYYSFEYDMSLSSMRSKVVLYYHMLKEAHNYKDIKRVYSEYDMNKKIADKIFRKKADGNYDFIWNVPDLSDYEDKQMIGKKQAELDCSKEYPDTVKENIQIFKDYLKLIEQHKIKPIVVVYPVSKYYSDYFSKRIEDEFNLIINEVKKEYNFQYVDYFRSELFKDDDFQDVSHLNSNGAEKFTEILNEIIEW